MLQNLSQLLTQKNQTTPVLPANINAQPLHMGDPSQELSPAVLKTIMQRFLQDFEYVELEYPVEGSATDPLRPLSHHPHVHFRMCGEDRAKLDQTQTAVYLGRQIDRGLFIMKKLGFEMDDFYVNPEAGTLSFDARVPNLPEGQSQHAVLKDFVAKMQEQCTAARANRGNSIAA